MLYKTTRRLFRGIYQYKIVLVCAGAQLFRNADMDDALEQLKKIDLSITPSKLSWRTTYIKTQDDLDYAFALQSSLCQLKDIDVRIESPWVTVYANSKSDIDSLANLDETKVKYICVPPDSTLLDTDTVIMPKMDYDYRVTLGKTTQPNPAFVSWAESNKNCKLTKSCIRDLAKTRSWGGTHFYITGKNNLLMAKMHLAGAISKVERIIKA
jgi:hypothetical protein